MARFLAPAAALLLMLMLVPAAGAQQTPSSAPTQAALARAILTRADVGAGYSVTSMGPRGDELVNYTIEFEREQAQTRIGVALADANAVSVFDLALQILRQNVDTGEDDVQTVNAPEIGQNSVRFFFTTGSGSARLYGDVIAWRHGTVTAAVVLRSTDRDLYARELAVRQEERLNSVFPLTSR
jgi:hypothetical protein